MCNYSLKDALTLALRDGVITAYEFNQCEEFTEKTMYFNSNPLAKDNGEYLELEEKVKPIVNKAWKNLDNYI